MRPSRARARALVLAVTATALGAAAGDALAGEPACFFEKGEPLESITTADGVAVTLFPSELRVGDRLVSRCNGLPASHPVAIAAFRDGFAVAFRDGATYASKAPLGDGPPTFEKLTNDEVNRATVTALARTRTALVATGVRPAVPDAARLGIAGALPSEHVTALAVHRDALVVGTFDRGLFTLDAGGTARPLDGAPRHVNALLATRAGLYVGSARGLFIVGGDGRVTPVPLDIPDPHVNGLAEGRDGTVWLATSNGLVGVTPGSRSPRVVGVREGLPSPLVYAVTETADGALWVGTARGVARIAPTGRDRVTLFGTENGKLPHDWVTALLEDGKGVLVGTYNAGVVRLGADGGSAVEAAFRNVWINPNGLVRLPARRGGDGDADGEVVATTLGDGLVAQRHAAFSPLPDDDVTAVVPFAGSLWVGTRGGIARVASAQ